MIQRQQTLWLLLSGISSLLSFMYPFVTGKIVEKGIEVDSSVNAGSNFLILLITGAILILAIAAIFLYKNRKLQGTLCIPGILLSLGVIILYVMQMNKMTKSTLALFCILPLFMLIGFILAYRNIRKDEKLVKSLDKLR
jgi:dipeptide/tripeptide permease